MWHFALMLFYVSSSCFWFLRPCMVFHKVDNDLKTYSSDLVWEQCFYDPLLQPRKKTHPLFVFSAVLITLSQFSSNTSVLSSELHNQLIVLQCKKSPCVHNRSTTDSVVLWTKIVFFSFLFIHLVFFWSPDHFNCGGSTE